MREWAINNFGASGELKVHFCQPRKGGLYSILFESTEEAAKLALQHTEKQLEPRVSILPWCP